VPRRTIQALLDDTDYTICIGSVQIRILTVGKLSDFVRGSSDFNAIGWLWTSKAEVHLISNLHAKIDMADRKRPILTSANFTSSGLRRNIEVGVLIAEQEKIKALAQTIEEWFLKGLFINIEWLKMMQKEILLNQKVADKFYQLDSQLVKYLSMSF
jgi:phosphatidylserine/phosphatidylglycerophosphate/cardiolipin synthase-like enzyme